MARVKHVDDDKELPTWRDRIGALRYVGRFISLVWATDRALTSAIVGLRIVRSFVPVASLLNSELVMVVHPSVGVNTVQEFIALAKSKPGALNYASSGVGSNYHMAGELFKNLTGTNILHVPYKGSAGARNDIISGQIEMMFDSVPSMAQMIQVGRVKALGTTGIGRGVAIPHTKHNCIQRPLGSVAISRGGVEFKSLDKNSDGKLAQDEVPQHHRHHGQDAPVPCHDIAGDQHDDDGDADGQEQMDERREHRRHGRRDLVENPEQAQVPAGRPRLEQGR